MKFCPACKNMLYTLSEDADDGQKFAVLECRKCEFKEKLDKNNPIVYEHILREDKTEKIALNPYLKYDPTLPRFTEMVCPNKECASNHGEKSDIVGVKIDAKELTWTYQCSICDNVWKQTSVSII